MLTQAEVLPDTYFRDAQGEAYAHNMEYGIRRSQEIFFNAATCKLASALTDADPNALVNSPVDWGDSFDATDTNALLLSLSPEGVDLRSAAQKMAAETGEHRPVITLDTKAGPLGINYVRGVKGNKVEIRLEKNEANAQQREAVAQDTSSHPPFSWGVAMAREFEARAPELRAHRSVRVAPDEVGAMPLEANDAALITLASRFKVRVAEGATLGSIIENVQKGTPPREVVDVFDRDDGIREIKMRAGTHGMTFVYEVSTDESGQQLVRPVVDIEVSEMARRGDAPFFESRTSYDMLGCLELAGLPLSERLHDAFTERPESNHYQSRYGNGYADITRTAYSVLGLGRESASLALFGEVVDEAQVTTLRAAAERLEEGPAKTALTIMCNVLQPQNPPEGALVFEKYTGGIGTKNDACKDVEVQFGRAHAGNAITEDAVFYSKNRNGAITSLNKVPIYVAGVEIPAGSVCRLNTAADGTIQVEPMRLTMFNTASNAQALDAFGNQYLYAVDALS